MLIQGLPPDSARARKHNGHHWGDAEYILAVIADRVGQAGAGTIKALGGKGVRAPKPLPRPGKKPGGKQIGDRGGRSNADALAFLRSLDPPPLPKAPPAGAADGHQAPDGEPPRKRVRAVRADRPAPTT